MSKYSDIKSSDWAFSLNSPYSLVQGVDAMNQSIHIIFNTRTGTAPLRPWFGSRIFDYIDREINRGAVLVAEEMRRCLSLEPRISVKNVTYEISTEVLGLAVFSISYSFTSVYFSEVNGQYTTIQEDVAIPTENDIFVLSYPLNFQL